MNGGINIPLIGVGGSGDVGPTKGPSPEKEISDAHTRLKGDVGSFFKDQPKEGAKSWALNMEVYSQKNTNLIKETLGGILGKGAEHTVYTLWVPPVAVVVALGTALTAVVTGVCALVCKAAQTLVLHATTNKGERAEVARLQKEIKKQSASVKEVQNDAKVAFYSMKNELNQKNAKIDKQIAKCIKKKEYGKLNDLLKEKDALLKSEEMKTLQGLEETFIEANNEYLTFEDRFIGTKSETSPAPTAAKTAENMKAGFFSQREKIIQLRNEGKVEIDETLLEAVKPENYEGEVLDRLSSLKQEDKKGVLKMLEDLSMKLYHAKYKLISDYGGPGVTVTREWYDGLKPEQQIKALNALGLTPEEIEEKGFSREAIIDAGFRFPEKESVPTSADMNHAGREVAGFGLWCCLVS